MRHAFPMGVPSGRLSGDHGGASPRLTCADPSTEMDPWTPDRIRSLRNERDQSQTEFGLDLLDATEGHAQSRVSRLEQGVKEPTAAEQRTLERMEAGEV